MDPLKMYFLLKQLISVISCYMLQGCYGACFCFEEYNIIIFNMIREIDIYGVASAHIGFDIQLTNYPVPSV